MRISGTSRNWHNIISSVFKVLRKTLDLTQSGAEELYRRKQAMGMQEDKSAEQTRAAERAWPSASHLRDWLCHLQLNEILQAR